VLAASYPYTTLNARYAEAAFVLCSSYSRSELRLFANCRSFVKRSGPGCRRVLIPNLSNITSPTVYQRLQRTSSFRFKSGSGASILSQGIHSDPVVFQHTQFSNASGVGSSATHPTTLAETVPAIQSRKRVRHLGRWTSAAL
jgi:hypothetical protein